MRFQKGFGFIVTMLQVSCARFANKIFFLVFCYSPLVRNGYEFSHIKFALIFKPRNVALRFLFEILSHNSVKFLWFTKYLHTKGPIISEDICGIFQLPKKYSVFLSLACWRLSFEFSGISVCRFKSQSH